MGALSIFDGRLGDLMGVLAIFCWVSCRYLMGVLEIFGGYPGGLMGVLEKFGGYPGDIGYVFSRYLNGILEIFDRYPGDI